MQIVFLKFLSSSGVILTFFAIATQLPGFFIGRLASGENFFDVNMFFNCKLNTNVSTIIYHICLVCYLKLCFYSLACSALSMILNKFG